MNASRTNVNSRSFDYDCAICLESMNDSDVVAHPNGAELHFQHRHCALEWAAISKRCAICQVEIDTATLFTWKERVVTALKPIAKEALLGGAGVAALLGVTPVVGPVGMSAGLVATMALASSECVARVMGMLEDSVGIAVITGVGIAFPGMCLAGLLVSPAAAVTAVYTTTGVGALTMGGALGAAALGFARRKWFRV